jgi:hypothetical protein
MSTEDAQAVLASLWPASEGRTGGFSSGQFAREIETGTIHEYSGENPSDCAHAGYNPAAYAQTGALEGAIAGGGKGAADGAIRAGLKAIPVIGDFLAQVWDKVDPFAAHARAVAREQGTLCQAVPQVNSAFFQIDSDFRAGHLSGQEAQAELDNVAAGFRQEVGAIIKEGPGQCNAACVIGHLVDAEVVLKKEQYANSPLYYVKRFWWVGLIILLFVLLGRR